MKQKIWNRFLNLGSESLDVMLHPHPNNFDSPHASSEPSNCYVALRGTRLSKVGVNIRIVMQRQSNLKKQSKKSLKLTALSQSSQQVVVIVRVWSSISLNQILTKLGRLNQCYQPKVFFSLKHLQMTLVTLRPHMLPFESIREENSLEC